MDRWLTAHRKTKWAKLVPALIGLINPLPEHLTKSDGNFMGLSTIIGLITQLGFLEIPHWIVAGHWVASFRIILQKTRNLLLKDSDAAGINCR